MVRTGRPLHRGCRDEIGRMVPYLRNRVGELRDWNDIRLLTVVIDRLREWYEPGVLCIGDAGMRSGAWCRIFAIESASFATGMTFDCSPSLSTGCANGTNRASSASGMPG